MAENDLLLP